MKSKEEKMLENEIKLKKQRGSEENSGGQLNQTKPTHIQYIYIFTYDIHPLNDANCITQIVFENE